MTIFRGAPSFCDLASTCEAKSNLVEELNVKFEHEVEHEEFPYAFNVYLSFVLHLIIMLMNINKKSSYTYLFC